MTTPAAFKGWLALAIVLVALDQLTKWAVTQTLTYGAPLALLPNLNFTLLHNPGAAFSFLAGAAGWQRWLFSTLAVGVSGYLVMLLRDPTPAANSYRAGLSLILGGALGNLIDRVRFGYVVDFIQVYHGNWYFPAFNLADSAITVGAGLVILGSLRGPAGAAANEPDRSV